MPLSNSSVSGPVSRLFALAIVLLFIINIPPDAVEAGGGMFTITKFNNNKDAVDVFLDGRSINKSVEIPIYPGAKIDTARMSVVTEGTPVTSSKVLNSSTELQTAMAGSDKITLDGGAVHLAATTDSLSLSNDDEFAGGSSNGVVAEDGVHLATGPRQYDQWGFFAGPGFLNDSMGVGFYTADKVDWGYGDGSLRLAHEYKITSFSASAPNPQVRGGAAYYATTNGSNLYLMGGWSKNMQFSDTWIFHMDSKTWEQKCMSCTPPGPLANASLGWNKMNSIPILAGGDSAGGLMITDQTYSYFDGCMTSWSNTGKVIPQPRTEASMVYDDFDDIGIMFGGRDNIGAQNTLYILRKDLSWSEPSTIYYKPSPRYGHSAVWDPQGKKMYVFGGQSDSISFLNDFYYFDYSSQSFTNMSYADGPSPRSFSQAMWDTNANAMILVGGRDLNTALDDVWAYFPVNNTWVKIGSISIIGSRWSGASGWNKEGGRGFVIGGLKDMIGNSAPDQIGVIDGIFKTQGAIESEIIDAGSPANWEKVSITTRGTSGSEIYGMVKFEYRTGDSRNTGDGSWTTYTLQEPETPFSSTSSPARYLQYRLTLVSINDRNTPVVQNLTIHYSYSATKGYLVTSVQDLRSPPLRFETFSFSGMTIPFTTMSFFLETYSASTGKWNSYPLVDNGSLRVIPTSQLIRFNITMASEYEGLSSYLFSITLGYSRVSPDGFYQAKVETGEAPIQWIWVYWKESEGSPNKGSSKISANLILGSINVILKNAVRIEYAPDKMPTPAEIMIQFNLTSDGSMDPGVSDIQIGVGTISQPRDISITVGDTSIPSTYLSGVQAPGTVYSVQKFSEDITNWLKSGKITVNEKGMTNIPVRLESKAPGRIILKDMLITGTVPNYPPVITSAPPATGQIGLAYTYRILAQDPDGDNLTYSIVSGKLDNMYIYDNILSWTPEQTQAGDRQIGIGVSDKVDTTFQSFHVMVDANRVNTPPKYISQPPDIISTNNTVILSLGDSFHYFVDLMDPDSGDVIVLSLEQGPKGMALQSSSRMLDWTPGGLDVGTFSVLLKASDGKGASFQEFKIIVLGNKAPYFEGAAPTKFNAQANKVFKYKIRATDPEGDTIKYKIIDGPSWLRVDQTGLASGTPKDSDSGSRQIIIEISDGHLNATTYVQLKVEKSGPGGMAMDDFYGLLILLAIIIIVATIIAVGYMTYRRKKRTKADIQARETHPTEVPVPRTPAAETPPAPPQHLNTKHHAQTHSAPLVKQETPIEVQASQPMAAPVPIEPQTEEKPIIEEIYLIYNDGRLIDHESRAGGIKMDEYILSGMLKAIQDFVKDSLQKEGALGGLDYGDFRIMLESGNCATIALVLKGKETKVLREETKRALERIEGLYAGVIECWDGDNKHFADVKKYILPLFMYGKTPEEEAEAGDAKIMSALEFYQGYVRLKAAVKNNFPFMIYDVSLKIIYDKKALQLSHVEPDYEREGSEVVIGNIPPNEKKTVAFYLDPLICMESSIDATAIFKNYKGELKTILMKRKPVDIVCPIFYTEQNVNVAMLKRLITELKYKDSKIFSTPKTLSPKEAMELAKHVVESRDVKFVREFIEEDPFIGEAWFYGKTKHGLEDLVIRATIREDRSLLELFVASNNLATLPGLLADLGHGLKKRYQELKRTKEGLTQVTDIKIKDELEKSRLLIDKYVSTEAEAKADETEL